MDPERNEPQALCTCPTRELVQQVGSLQSMLCASPICCLFFFTSITYTSSCVRPSSLKSAPPPLLKAWKHFLLLLADFTCRTCTSSCAWPSSLRSAPPRLLQTRERLEDAGSQLMSRCAQLPTFDPAMHSSSGNGNRNVNNTNSIMQKNFWAVREDLKGYYWDIEEKQFTLNRTLKGGALPCVSFKPRFKNN